jgi:pimeloyl-ACP methyl ester carboxylesterase
VSDALPIRVFEVPSVPSLTIQRRSHDVNTKLLIAILLAPMGYVAAASTRPMVQSETRATEIVIATASGKQLRATYRPAPAPKALILLFHQAGADRREYNDIVPRLAGANYSTLTVDQGGGGFGQRMIDGKPDMEAALNWAQDKGIPVVIWGSSYSASIVYLLAAEQPAKIKAALAFSGGEYLGGNRVTIAARTVSIPIFATSSLREVSEMRAIFDLVPNAEKQFFIPSLGGVHGSETLSPRRNPLGAASNWDAVLAFLNRALQN